jgi:hypothetical protein
MDDLRVANSLKQTRESDRNYLKDRFTRGNDNMPSQSMGQKLMDERPTKDMGPNLPAKTAPVPRATINIDENDESNDNFAMNFLARGTRLRDQMDEALEADRAWEDLHGPHTIAKKYVPPFSTDELDQFEKGNGRPPDFNDIGELLHLKDDEADN